MIINSREIDDLRPDVAANIHMLKSMSEAAGFPFGVACTYRNQEAQTALHLEGKAPALVAFHGWRLAIDIFQNIPGRLYEPAFFDFVIPRAKKIGFSWMYDMIGSDKPHLQWDFHRKVSSTQLRNGVLVPPMPLYQEEDHMSQFIENMAEKYGTTTAEIEVALERLLHTQMHLPFKWEKTGEEFLRTKGLTTSLHNPNEVVTFGILGAIESKRK